VRLRTTLTVVMTGVGGIAVGVAVVLVILSSALYQTSVELRGATERVRLLMELESYALQQVRAAAGSESQPAIDILDRLRQTPERKTREDFQSLEEMIQAVTAAPTAAERESRLEAVVREIRSVVAREDENARRAMAASASWNRLANVSGIIALVVLLAGIAGVLAWLWRSALQPLVTMIGAIQRFAKGDMDARAAEEGPTEIRQIAVAFNDMAVSLERQREEQLAFIGGVAHDLRTPLDALQVGVTLLGQPPSDPLRVRDRIRRQIERLQHMIDDLLDRTRIEAGRFELHREDCDLRELLARVVDIQRDFAPTRAFRLLVPHEPVWARCDALRIEQMVNNLLSNAVKYSRESSDVEILLDRDDSGAVLSVTDHGIGMTAIDRSRVFEPFRRGKNVGNIGGTGLGLSVTRKIVEAHGGSIDVRSEPGSGSVFSVRLPVISDADVNRDRSGRTVEPASLLAR
jgi:two-component system, OmpR family, sensor histidine kinase MtrB